MSKTDETQGAKGRRTRLGICVAYFDGVGYGLMEAVILILPFLSLISLSVGLFAGSVGLVLWLGRLLGLPANLFTGIVGIMLAALPIQLLFRGMARSMTDFYAAINSRKSM